MFTRNITSKLTALVYQKDIYRLHCMIARRLSAPEQHNDVNVPYFGQPQQYLLTTQQKNYSPNCFIQMFIDCTVRQSEDYPPYNNSFVIMSYTFGYLKHSYLTNRPSILLKCSQDVLQDSQEIAISRLISTFTVDMVFIFNVYGRFYCIYINHDQAQFKP